MCNEYRFSQTRDGLAELLQRFQIPLAWADAPSNRPPGEPIKPTNRAPMLRPIDPANPLAGLEGMDVRWWLVPFFHKGAVKDWRAMCTNARFEEVDTKPAFRDAYKRRRALIPVTSFIEYSEPPGWKKGQPKMRHEITWGDEIRFFAGLWDRATPSDMPEGLTSFTFITGPCCADVEPIHDRTPSILTLEQGMQWLDLSGPGKAGFAELPPAGSYTVAHAPRETIIPAELRKML